jgi:DNA polymerase-3 subunit delta
MSIEILKSDIKRGSLNKVYLFFGPESYLVEYYLKEVEKMLVEPEAKSFNYSIFEGKGNESKIITAAETIPFMGKTKMIVVRDSGLFGKSKKGESEKDYDLGQDSDIEITNTKIEDKNNDQNIIEYIENIPQDVHLIFVENEVNKNTKAYKAIKKIGVCVQFDYQTLDNLERWAIRVFDSNKIKASKEELDALIHLCNFSMVEILNEINKLSAYLGKDSRLTMADIEKICPQRLQNKIFDMMDAVGQKNSVLAFKLLGDMLSLKEPPQKIILLLARHFKLMLYIKQLKSKKHSNERIGEVVGLHSFIVGKYLKQCEHFSAESLQNAMEDCLGMDRNIKTGKMDARIALEAFVGKYA